MLSPAEKLYFWAKRDRAVAAREPSFFGTRSQSWRDLVPPRRDAEDYAPRYLFRGMRSMKASKPVRPTWTPWLWVK